MASMQSPLSWGCAIAWGYALSLLVGLIVTTLYDGWARGRVDKFARRLTDDKPGAGKVTDSELPSIVTGLVERFIFTAFVILAPKDATLAMGGWLTLKVAASWQCD